VTFAASWRRVGTALGLVAALALPVAADAASVADARAAARLYSAAFDREPDADGLNFWIDSLDQGVPLLRIAEQFRNSPEFQARYGELGDLEFVRQLYRNVLRREGEPSGVDYWVGVLASGTSQATVLKQFSDSRENRRKTDDLFAEMHRGEDGRWRYEAFSGPLRSTGTIDGFGSIFVNGVEFETDGAAILVNDQPASEDDLKLGMVVTVQGVVADGGATGNAVAVSAGDELQGPVTAIEPGPDGDTLLVTVLGVQVIVERTSTVFDDVRFDNLQVGDVVEVSGFVDEEGRLRATRVERKSSDDVDAGEVELKGIVAGLSGSEFSIGDYVVDFSEADLSRVPGGMPVEGMHVEVEGTLDGTRIAASKVSVEDDVLGDVEDEDDISVQGAVTEYLDLSSFVVNGVTVNGEGAVLRPADLALGDGVVVQVEGTWEGDVLVARTIEARRGRVEVEATVLAVDSGAGTITLELPGGTVTVQVDARSLLDDDTGVLEDLTLEDIVAGDFLEVEAIQVGDVLVATRIDRDDPGEDVLQAPVTAFDRDAQTVTLLGIIFRVSGASFEGLGGDALDAAAFFDRLQVGDLLKVKDRNGDGIADEVEFERRHALDGDDCEADDGCDLEDEDCEFDDDCDHHDDECEAGDDCSDDSCERGDDCSAADDHCESGDDCSADDEHCDDDDCSADDEHEDDHPAGDDEHDDEHDDEEEHDD